MKQTKKLITLLLVLALTLSMIPGIPSKADTSIQVTLRVEQDGTSCVTPVNVTLTDADKRDFGIGLSTEKLTPLHALAKYMESKKGATDKTMSHYIALADYYGSKTLVGISTEGKCDDANTVGGPSSLGETESSWMFAVNDAAPMDPVAGWGYTADAYPLIDGDNLVFYGIWYGVWGSIDTYYTTFEKANYETKVNQAATLNLRGVGIYESAVKAATPVSDASITVSEYKDENSCSTEKNSLSDYNVTTDVSGNASLTFKKAGTYVISAYRKSADKLHYDISRPYALIKVTDEVTKPQSTPAATNPVVNTPAPTKTPIDSPKPVTTRKLSKPTGLKVKIAKTKKSKKKITLSWSKTTNAEGYRIYLSSKKKTGFKKIADVKKSTLTWKKKKGTYYVKVKAFATISNKKIFSKYSSVKKIKVKK